MHSFPSRILLTGGTGFLGHFLRRELEGRGVEILAGDRSVLDLSAPDSLLPVVREMAPDVILHAAAMSRMSDCEEHPGVADVVNHQSVVRLAETGIRMVHVSTDLVFGGDAAPYASADVAVPRSEYGRSKAAAEEALSAFSNALVVRVPLMFGKSWNGRCGATDMIRNAAAEGRSVGLYENEFRTPLHVGVAARCLVELALGDRFDRLGNGAGLVQIAGRERVSRAELGERFVAIHGLGEGVVGRSVCESTIRPRDVSMASDVEIRESLDEMLALA